MKVEKKNLYILYQMDLWHCLIKGGFQKKNPSFTTRNFQKGW